MCSPMSGKAPRTFSTLLGDLKGNAGKIRCRRAFALMTDRTAYSTLALVLGIFACPSMAGEYEYRIAITLSAILRSVVVTSDWSVLDASTRCVVKHSRSPSSEGVEQSNPSSLDSIELWESPAGGDGLEPSGRGIASLDVSSKLGISREAKMISLSYRVMLAARNEREIYMPQMNASSCSRVISDAVTVLSLPTNDKDTNCP